MSPGSAPLTWQLDFPSPFNSEPVWGALSVAVNLTSFLPLLVEVPAAASCEEASTRHLLPKIPGQGLARTDLPMLACVLTLQELNAALGCSRRKNDASASHAFN